MIPYEQALHRAVETDKAVVLTAENRSCLRHIPPIIGDKFIDVGIAEQTMVGMAAGLAQSGMIPVVHALAAFLTMRAYEFIRTDLAYPGLKALLVGTFAGLQSTANGPTHQAIEDIALMSALPHTQTYVPYCDADLVQCIQNLPGLKGPMYLRYNDVSKPNYTPPAWGENACFKHGKGIAILSYGWLLDEALKAQAQCQSRGLHVSVYNCRFVAPSPKGFIQTLFQTYHTVVVVEDHVPSGGLYDQLLREKALTHANTSLIPVHLQEYFFVTGTYADARTLSGLDAERIAHVILESVSDEAFR